MTIAVTGAGGIVRQTVPQGGIFPGHASNDTEPRVVEGVIEHVEEPAAPGTDHAASAATANPGSNYTVGDVLTLAGGTFTIAAQIRVDELGAGDMIVKFTIINAGVYSVTPGNPVPAAGGTGSNATFNVVWGPIGNGGFLNLAQFLDRNIVGGDADKKVSVFWYKILVGAGVAWALYVTDGRGLAPGGSFEIDNPVDDAPVASGTGSVAQATSIELAPHESLRLITGAASTTVGVFQVHFIPAKSTYGRHFQ